LIVWTKESGRSLSRTTYGGDQENDHESIGDLAPEDLVPLDASIALKFIETILLKASSGFDRRETLEDAGVVVLCSLLDSKSVERCLRFEIDGAFTHIK
jgi:hypothetical protein